MTVQTCGFKGSRNLIVKQELPRKQPTRKGAWSAIPFCGLSIKPSELATATCSPLGLFGGRCPENTTDEHDTTDGGIGHE